MDILRYRREGGRRETQAERDDHRKGRREGREERDHWNLGSANHGRNLMINDTLRRVYKGSGPVILGVPVRAE